MREAASAVWGVADADDARWITDGMTDGPTLERWHVRRGPRLIQPPLLASVPTGPEGSEEAPDGAGLNLPASFWQERESLRHIEQAARARWASPDAVLGVAFARLSSYLHPADTVDLGIGCGPLSVFTIVYGPSSAGKGTAARTGAELLVPPESVALGTFRERPLGSGEGITESYFAMVTESGATGKSVKVHKQVRSNVLFTADEGEAVLKTAGRKGTTIATTIRRAWSGEILGEANATAERDRQLERGAYAIGMILAFQPATIASLFDENEVGGGTPQRFLFFAADDDSLPEAPPEDLPEWPGVLTVPTVRLAPGEPCRFALNDEDARQEVRMTRWRGLRRQHEPGQLDGHELQQRGRVAALLALLEGRWLITGDDWRLAGEVVQTSARVRAAAVRYGVEQAAKRAQAADDRHVRREERVEAARLTVADLAVEQRVAHVAALLARKVLRDAAAEGLVKRKLYDAAGRYRRDTAAALEHAVSSGWLVVEEAGRSARYRVGPRIGEVVEAG